MVREYICEECGETFVKDTKMRCAARYCPKCRKLVKNKQGAEWRQRQRDKAIQQMKLKRLNKNNNG